MTELPIAKISISKFMGIEELSFKPGSITVFRAKNGRGKTSAAKAILAAFKGAKGQYVRDGESEARILVELSNATVLDRRIVRDGKAKAPRIKPASGPAESSPAAWLADQVDDLINPLDFLAVAEDRRLSWLLEAVPLQVTADELKAACGDTMPVTDLRVSAGKHALIAIDETYQRLYDARRESNIQARGKRQSIEQLQASLPPLDEEATDWAVVEQELASQAGALNQRLESAKREAMQAERVERNAAGAEFTSAERAIRQEIEAQIAALKAEEQRRIGEARAAATARIQIAESARYRAIEAITQQVAGDAEGLSDSLGNARAKREEADRAANTRTIMDRFGMEAVTFEQVSRAYDGAMQNLGELKKSLMSRMPIAGIEMINGKLCRNGLPFEVLNTAQCIDIAMEVAEMRAGKIGLICVDGIERLDTEMQQRWFDRAKNSGLHFVFTEVSDDESLTIETAA